MVKLFVLLIGVSMVSCRSGHADEKYPERILTENDKEIVRQYVKSLRYDNFFVKERTALIRGGTALFSIYHELLNDENTSSTEIFVVLHVLSHIKGD